MNKFFLEIKEQPDAIANLLGYYSSAQGEDILSKVKNIISGSPDIQVVFTGMGSSYFISHAASTLFNSLNINSAYINAGELLHYNLSLLGKNILLVCISQSGESFEIREILSRLPSGVKCLGIVNDEESTLALRSEIALPAKAGKEEMTSTKTFIATSLVSYIMGWHLAGMWSESRKSMIKHLAKSVRNSINNYESDINNALDFLGNITTLQIIARGPSFSTASQGALMFKEALHIPATGILGGEFRHGPMEMVTEGFRAIVFSAVGNTFDQTNRMAEDIAGFGGRVMLITNKKALPSNNNIFEIVIDEQDEYLFSVGSILPVQLFVDMYAKSKGFEAGSFSRGSKVTEIE